MNECYLKIVKDRAPLSHAQELRKESLEGVGWGRGGAIVIFNYENFVF